MIHTTPGTPHLLVVGNRRRRRPEVHHEAEVGLVETHTERGRGDQGLHPVGQQILLRLQPVGVLRLPRIGSHRIPALPQKRRDLLSRRHRQGVDDPRTLQVPQPLPQPRQPVRRTGQLQHSEPEALPVQRPPQNQSVPAPRAQLLSHIRGHPRVRRRRRGQHRHPRRQLRQHRAQPTVVRPEIMTPVRNTVRLIDHQQTSRRRELREHLVTEIHGIETFRTHEENVGLTALHLSVDRLPFLRVRGVDGARLNPRPRRRFHLVTHQREQWRNDHRRAGPTPPQQSSSHEIDRRLTPAGALHHQRTTALLHQSRHRLPLVLPQPRRTPRGTHQLSENGIGFSAQLQGVHPSMQPDGTDNQRIHPLLQKACEEPASGRPLASTTRSLRRSGAKGSVSAGPRRSEVTTGVARGPGGQGYGRRTRRFPTDA